MSRQSCRILHALSAVAIVATLSACSLLEEDDGVIEASGTIEVREVAVGTGHGGRVASVSAREGERVEKGQILVALDVSLVDAAIREAEAARDAAEAEKDRVEAGPREGEIRVAEALLAGAIARWDGSRRAWEAGETALRQAEAVGDAGTIEAARSGAAAAAMAYRQTEAAVDAARADLDALRDGADPVAVAAARASAELSRAGLQELLARRETFYAIAPVAGEVVAVGVEPGSLAMPGASLVRLADLTEVTLPVFVSETDIGNIRLGQNVEVTVDAYPDETFRGNVAFISPQAEFTPRNVQTKDQRAYLVFGVEVAIPNEDGRLRPGMPANARVDVD